MLIHVFWCPIRSLLNQLWCQGSIIKSGVGPDMCWRNMAATIKVKLLFKWIEMLLISKTQQLLIFSDFV